MVSLEEAGGNLDFKKTEGLTSNDAGFPHLTVIWPKEFRPSCIFLKRTYFRDERHYVSHYYRSLISWESGVY